MDSHKVLVVEDNLINLKLVQVLLAKHGYHVLSAIDAEQALEVLKEHRPALILMDLQLPGMDGIQLTKLLKSNPQTKNIIILALTAYAMHSDKERAIAAGFDGYITKPFDTRQLPITIDQCINKTSLQQA
jgi:two-component system, cell cycle response regulator DivK